MGKNYEITPAKNISAIVAGEPISAKIIEIANEEFEDLAIIKVESLPPNATPVNLGDSSKIKTGDTIYAIGNSYGEGLCITQGVVSDNLRNVSGHMRIMTDAALNPGNSGCPYFNTNGKVVGVHVAGAMFGQAELGGARTKVAGMKYGIPINMAKILLKKRAIKYFE